MRFQDIQVNTELCRALVGMIDSGKLPHAIMLHEDDGGEGVAIALAFLQYLYCHDRQDGDSCGQCPNCNRVAKMINPDIHFVFPTAAGHTSDEYIEQWRSLVAGGVFGEDRFKEALEMSEKSPMIAVSQASSLIRTLSLSALEGGYRSVFIYLPELMNQEAANKLLKLVEEPPLQTQFIMVTHAPEKVLTTIASRCQRLRVLPSGASPATGAADAAFEELFCKLMDALVSRDLFSALQVGAEISGLPNRESAKAFCKFAAEQLRWIFLKQQGVDSLVSASVSGKILEYAAKCRKTFPRRASEAFTRAQMLIGRNVNAKIIFTDLASRLYTSI